MAHSRNSACIMLASDDDIRRGVGVLRRKCAVIRMMHDRVGDPPLRNGTPGFAGLAEIVVSQQVSAASADAIWARVEKAAQPFTARALLKMSDEELRACGLSRPKVKTLRAVAEAVAARTLRLETFAGKPDDEVHAEMTAVWGVGPWTADIYLMFCTGRPDAWSSGDLALQIAVQRAFGLKDKPTPAELDGIAERWRPWRAVAARLLWKWYVEGQ
jgi:DNA-3-methyladenine glycosylase II